MADFNATGIEGLALSLEEVTELPEDIVLEMLQAEGEVVADAQRKKIRELDLVDSGQMMESITVDKKLRSAGRLYDRGGGYTGLPGMVRYINVYPRGTRKGAGASVQTSTRKFKKRRKGATESTRVVTNSEVAFENEFGVPSRGIPATQWMRDANEDAADAAVDAAMKVYDKFLKSKDL